MTQENTSALLCKIIGQERKNFIERKELHWKCFPVNFMKYILSNYFAEHQNTDAF